MYHLWFTRLPISVSSFSEFPRGVSRRRLVHQLFCVGWTFCLKTKKRAIIIIILTTKQTKLHYNSPVLGLWDPSVSQFPLSLFQVPSYMLVVATRFCSSELTFVRSFVPSSQSPPLFVLIGWQPVSLKYSASLLMCWNVTHYVCNELVGWTQLWYPLNGQTARIP